MNNKVKDIMDLFGITETEMPKQVKTEDPLDKHHRRISRGVCDALDLVRMHVNIASLDAGDKHKKDFQSYAKMCLREYMKHL